MNFGSSCKKDREDVHTGEVKRGDHAPRMGAAQSILAGGYHGPFLAPLRAVNIRVCLQMQHKDGLVGW
jgi:hypothetical protein